jgi:hypothetical protein
MTLTDGQRLALRNLARKQSGEDVDWINIADARALTELGLAERNRGGWEITPAGLALLETQAPDPPPAPVNNVDPMRRP